jgi:hypothetical protein
MAGEKIFISYRREDTSGESGRLKDKLEQIFGQENIFYDVETLEAGLNFDESIDKALGESKVLLAMIGPHWLKLKDSKGVIRLHKEDDWVRKEIAEALKRGLRVIPVLVNGAEMPDADELPESLKPLSLKHAQELSSSRWNYDVGELTKVLERIVTKKQIPKQVSTNEGLPKHPFVPLPPPPKSWIAKNHIWVIVGILAFLFFVGMCTTEGLETFDSTVNNSGYEADTGVANVSQEPDQLVTDMTGQWVLYMDGARVSVFAFGQTGNEVSYYEYDVNNLLTAEGFGHINGSEMVLTYKSTILDMTGTISLTTRDSGLSWTGTISSPAIVGTKTVALSRN